MDPAKPNLTLQLPRDVYHQVIHTLRAALPPITDAPADLVHRDNAAIAMVASLLPANADETNLAAQYAAASAHAIECLRQAQEHRGNLTNFLKCEARADSMQRQARGFRTLLLRVQAERRKRETDNAATDRAAWTEHCAIGLMADALGRAPLTVMVEPPPATDPVREAEPKADPQADIAAEADFYAAVHPQRAARIRGLGGLPAKLDFGPPSSEIVHAIVTGTSPALQALGTTDHRAMTAVTLPAHAGGHAAPHAPPAEAGQPRLC
jgi:hypothetical protein